MIVVGLVRWFVGYIGLCWGCVVGVGLVVLGCWLIGFDLWFDLWLWCCRICCLAVWFWCGCLFNSVGMIDSLLWSWLFLCSVECVCCYCCRLVIGVALLVIYCVVMMLLRLLVVLIVLGWYCGCCSISSWG